MPLVLTRRAKEEIIITVGVERIILHVAEIDHGKVRLAFNASEMVRINRSEVQDRIDEGRE